MGRRLLEDRCGRTRTCRHRGAEARKGDRVWVEAGGGLADAESGEPGRWTRRSSVTLDTRIQLVLPQSACCAHLRSSAGDAAATAQWRPVAHPWFLSSIPRLRPQRQTRAPHFLHHRSSGEALRRRHCRCPLVRDINRPHASISSGSSNSRFRPSSQWPSSYPLVPPDTGDGWRACFSVPVIDCPGANAAGGCAAGAALVRAAAACELVLGPAVRIQHRWWLLALAAWSGDESSFANSAIRADEDQLSPREVWRRYSFYVLGKGRAHRQRTSAGDEARRRSSGICESGYTI
jgi:hypothetical protein